MKLDLEKILQLPLTTNHLVVSVDMPAFFSSYAIISYYSFDREYKNLAYEQLATVPFCSVTGIRAKWEKEKFPYTKFFILVKKEFRTDVIDSLRNYEQIYRREDDLSSYAPQLQQRVIASLVINSLGDVSGSSKMLYNDGSLLLCDDKNFLVSKSRKELVCLRIEVNEYMNLVAKTVSFSHPRDHKHLRRHSTCVFHVNNDVSGQWWSGLAVKPIVIRNMRDTELNLDELYIRGKRFSDTHNIVPYWPYNTENYTHGRLFAISQVMESVNTRYESLVQLSFADYHVTHYDEYRPEKNTIGFLQEYFQERSIWFDDTFNTDGSRQFISYLQKSLQEVADHGLLFPKKPGPDSLVIRLCEPIDDDSKSTLYAQSLTRMGYSGTALQHVIYDSEEVPESVSKSMARRILLDLLVKDAISHGSMPESLIPFISDWDFTRYKIVDGDIIGASLRVDGNKLIMTDYGLAPSSLPTDFYTFACDKLHYSAPDKIKGSRDYKVMCKGGNVYLIIDTDEIPILDFKLIDEGYNQIVNQDEVLSMFKRKHVAHDYLRGYIGFHLWQTEGLDGETAYAYIAGFNSENMQIMKSTKMDRVPRARRIFILHAEKHELVQQHIMEIAGMLKMGFGRWNELMTYPFPFKFLQEYLDNACEIAYRKHWSEISSSTLL